MGGVDLGQVLATDGSTASWDMSSGGSAQSILTGIIVRF